MIRSVAQVGSDIQEYKMSRLHILLLSLLLLVSFRGYSQEVAHADSVARGRAFDYYYMQALTYKELGDYASALDVFEHCLAISPDNPSLLFELYPLYSFFGRDNEALNMLERAVAADSDNFWYREQLASHHIQQGDFAKAIELLENLSAKNRSNVDVYMLLMGLYEETGQYAKAAETVERYELAEGSNEATSMQKYHYYRRAKDRPKAIAAIRALINENPGDSRYKVYLGDTYLLFNMPDSAYICYSTLLDEDPTNLLAEYSLSKYYQANNNDSLYCGSMERVLFNDKLTEEARSEATIEYIAYKERAGDVSYIYNLFDSLMLEPYAVKETAAIYADYMLMKNVSPDSVVPIMNKLLEYEPENNRAQLYMLVQAVKKEDYNEVVERCNKAIHYMPENLLLYYYKGVSCYALERPQEAIDTYVEGLKRRADDEDPALVSDVFGSLGDIYHELQQVKDCYQAYDSALVYNSENITVLNNYAYFLSLDEQRLDEALEMSYRTIKESPEEVTYLDTYAWILFKLGRYEEARAYAEKMLTIVSEISYDVYVHVGDIYSKCGDIDNALKYWIKAQEEGDKSKLLQKKIKRRKYIPDEKKKK